MVVRKVCFTLFRKKTFKCYQDVYKKIFRKCLNSSQVAEKGRLLKAGNL